MRLRSLAGNTQKLDGGAMFGNCPRALWQDWCPPDERHRILLACRCLLVQEDSGRNVLLETGIGAFFPPKLRDRYGVVEPEHVLLSSLAEVGLRRQDVDVVVLSHLHFDHAGGLLASWREGAEAQLAFPRATVVVGRKAWDRANAPHARDRASFVPELQALLRRLDDRLEVVEGDRSRTLGERYSFVESQGHTPGLLLARVETGADPVTFMGDLCPGVPWVHVPITMGYDRFPELLIDEKQALLSTIEAEHGWAFFTHDPTVAAAHVARDERGKFTATDRCDVFDLAT